MANQAPPEEVKALEFAYQAHLAEFNALRQQVLEWTRLQWTIATAAMAATVAVLVFLLDKSKANDATIGFLVLPGVFVYFGVCILAIQRRIRELGSYLRSLSGKVNLIISILGSSQAAASVLQWEAVKDFYENKNRLWGRIVRCLQPVTSVVASIASLLLFVDRDRHLSSGEGLLLGLDVLLVTVFFLYGVIYAIADNTYFIPGPLQDRSPEHEQQ